MGGSDEKEAAKKLQKSYFDVLGLCCTSEVPLIEKILKPLDGVKDVSVIVPSRTVIVLHDNLLISQLQIVKVLNKARLEANIRVKGEGNYKKKWPSPYTIACGILLLLSFLKYVYHPLQWLALGAVAIGICPIFMRAVAAIRNLTLDVNILVIIAVVGSIVLHDYWEAASIVFLFTIAEWLESRASNKATAVMSSLVNIVPQRAILAESGEEVDAEAVNVGAIIAVKAGETIPIDGIVIEGDCEVDEKTLTGESFPVSKQKESTVWAGTINLNGYISVETTALAEDCVVARMAKLVEAAQNNKSKTQRLIDRCAKYYTPAVVIISVSLAVIPAALRVHNQNEWFHLALVVLVSACPCALVLSTPVATFCALSKAATFGLLIKGGEYLETLAKVKIMAFDKTGTITRGEFIVSDFQPLLDDVSLNTLLFWVSSIESKSSHPMAAALVEYGHSHSVEPKADKVEEFRNFPGEGIYGKIDGKHIYVGNRKIAIRAGCERVPTLEGKTKEGKSIGYIFSGARPAGIFSLSDACRTGVKEAIKELKSLGIKTAMLTGDSHTAAIYAQHQLEGALDIVHAELLPEDKARIIEDFQKEAPTAMIGDGLNDAPALATADIGISMGISGSALATETGHVILMSNDIRKIPKAARLARRTRRKIIENVILSITTKAAIIALAIAGHPLVWAAVLADVGTCLLVISNSMLLLRGTHNHGTKCSKSHVHKHGSDKDHNHSSHHHKNCCSDTKAQKMVDPQKKCSSHQGCASRSQPVKNKCSDSSDTHGCCASDNRLHGAKQSDHERCTTVVQDGSNCTKTVEKHGGCLVGDGVLEPKNCHHGTRSTISHDMVSQTVNNHWDANRVELSQHEGHNGHFHSTHCVKNHVKNQIAGEGSTVEASPNHSAPVHTTIDVSFCSNHEECGSIKACKSLEKRHIGGCCKSYRKECCGRSGHLGANLGGLSEIIID